MIGLLYFIVIVLANTVGAISGMGGGVIIKPAFDFIGVHSVVAISFYSTVAVFTMSTVSTLRQFISGMKLDWAKMLWISVGSLIGGMFGNLAFEFLLWINSNPSTVQLIQIILTILTLLFALIYSKYNWTNYHLNNVFWYVVCGLILGFLASLLGIGGGPINVSLLMLLFSMPIKEATMYSICTIFFSQLSKLATISLTTGFQRYDLSVLLYVIPAAILGGLLGAKSSNILPPEKITLVFQIVIIFVLIINIYNGWRLF